MKNTLFTFFTITTIVFSLSLIVVQTTPVADAWGGGGSDGGGEGGSYGGDGCGGCGSGNDHGGSHDDGGGDPDPIYPICVIDAQPPSIEQGESSVLTWTTTRAASARINTSVGSNIGTVSIGSNRTRTVSPVQTTVYTMIVTSSTGHTATCNTDIEVTVTPPPTPTFSCTNNVSFTASPTSITRGNSSTLSWNVTGADSVRFNQGINRTTFNDSVSVSPNNTTTYTLYAKKDNVEISCPVTVSVTTGGGGGGGYVVPVCDLEASKSSVAAGETVKLTWTSRNANEMELKDNYRVVHVTTVGKTSSQKHNLLNGSINVNPTKKTTYTLTIENNNGRKRVCEVTVDVDSFIQQIRDQQPVVTGIVLTEVPYTGFDAGPMLTALFYTLLVLWALYMAYVFVIRPKLAVVPVEEEVKNNHFTATVAENHPAMFTPEVTRPVMATPSVATTTSTAPIGYTSAPVGDEATIIEEKIHAAHILMSGVAMDYFMKVTAEQDRLVSVDTLIENAKASFPSEGGWVVLNEDRIKQILA